MPSLAEAIRRGIAQDGLSGIPSAEEEALQRPDWDPVDAAVAGLTSGGNIPARLAASGVDAVSQEIFQQMPWWLAMPISLAMGRAASKAMPEELVPGGAKVAEVGAVGDDVGKYVDVWHASPHRFDKFDSSMIGSGEGSQYRGFGLYFAENPNVSGAASIGEHPSSYDGLFQRRIRRAPDFKAMEYGPLADKHGLEDEHIINVLRHGTEVEQQALRRSDPARFDYWQQNRPSIYQVRLHENPNNFLNLDAPIPHGVIDRIGPNVQDAIVDRFDRWGMNSPVDVPEAYTGWDLYKSLMNEDVQDALPEEIGGSSWYTGATSPKQHAAAYLQSLGIPGTRFFDKLSRLAGGNTRNYVMFPGGDDKIEILKRYGLLMPLMGAAAAEQDE